jgi:hypothetical protein
MDSHGNNDTKDVISATSIQGDWPSTLRVGHRAAQRSLL